MTVGRRLWMALEAAVADPGSWPLGMLGFLVRGGLVVLALPILILPSPVGVATLLGPAVISTGRLEGPLLRLLVAAGTCLLVLVMVAVVLAALVQVLLHERWGRTAPRPFLRTAGRLVATELLAIVPVAAVISLTVPGIVDEVREELLLPGDLAVPLAVRVASRVLLPLGTLVAAILVTEALDGCLSRRSLVARHPRRSPARGLLDVVVTAALGWCATLLVLIPGLTVITAIWAAARAAFSGLPSADPTSSQSTLALVAVVAMIAAWLGVLWFAGIASIVRAHLWTSRASVAGDWTRVGH